MTAADITTPVVDQEFVVHLFAPLRGPDAAGTYRDIRLLWLRCGRQLGITSDVSGFSPGELPPTPAELASDFVAVRESPAADRYCVLRRLDDLINISVALAQPAPEGLRSQGHPPRRRLGWTDFARLWARLGSHDSMLGEARLYLARTPPGSMALATATAELGRSLDPLLPPRPDRAAGWQRYGVVTADGFAVWDTNPAGDTDRIRELVLIAAADQDDEMSAWAWSDGSAMVPPFARYLSHATRLRFEARLLATWHRGSVSADTGQILAELAATIPERAGGDQAEMARSRLRRLRAEEAKMADLQSDLARLNETVIIARANLAVAPGAQSGAEATGIFAADQALAGWLTGQIEHDLRYVTIDLDRIRRAAELAAEDLQATPPDLRRSRGAAAVVPAEDSGTARRVFVVHGRDSDLAARFFDLLRSMKLEPLEWEWLVAATGTTAPYLGQVVAQAPHLAQATLVLLSPDDIVELHSELFQSNDLPQERARSAQARPNVYFELGLALMAYPERTIVIEVGQMRPVADLAGLNVIRFDGSSVAVKKVLARLRLAGCHADDSGTDWLALGRFSDLTAYCRGPDTQHAGDE